MFKHIVQRTIKSANSSATKDRAKSVISSFQMQVRLTNWATLQDHAFATETNVSCDL
jgi:hypothetical protein